MIGISELDAFGAAAVEACADINDYILISTEAEMKDYIEDIKGYPFMVCAFPSATGDDKNTDNYAERNRSVFYVLDKMNEQYNRAERLAAWTKTQTAMKHLKQFILDQVTDQTSEFYELLNDADFGKRDIEPEFNFLGNIGWSLLFDYTTTGL